MRFSQCIVIQQREIKQEEGLMQLVEKYIRKHDQHMMEVFSSLGKDDTIEATKVFSYIQAAFNLQHFVFEFKGENFFQNEQNASGMEKLIERYYRKNESDSKKFYLYRIHFAFEEIGDIIEFWIKHEPQLKIIYKEVGQPVQEHETKQQVKKQEQEENQFDVKVQEMPKMLQQYRAQKQKHEEVLKEENIQFEKQQQTKKKIQELNYKIKTLEQRIKASSSRQDLNIQKKTQSPEKKEEHSPTNSNSSKKKQKITINYKGLFDFYSKQTHLTGGKATFDRIQHESQTLNYQKLVHFLREFGLMPAKNSEQKQIHHLYIRTCEKTRDLSYKGFIKFLDGLVEIIFKRQEGDKKELLKERILQRKKEGKMLNFPFHTLVSEDFRIKSKDIKYQFKIKPQYGKFQDQVNDELEVRRKIKNDEKEQKQKERQIKKVKYLKRLQSVDPFHPDLAKYSQLLEKSMIVSEPIASLDNIERYRDDKFDFKSHLGIDLDNNFLPGRAKSGRSNESYKKVEKLEKDQAQKLKNLMSGIIERSNAKLEKLGIPNRQVKFA